MAYAKTKGDRDFNPFNRIRVETQGYNTFDLSYDNKLTLAMGKLVPVMMTETIPGDIMSITPEMLLRFQPLIAPVMHRIDATIHFFYVPKRIMWANWEKYLAGENYAHPYIQGSEADPLFVGTGSLYDYINLPPTNNLLTPVDAFPVLAYYRIYNEYYQDQNNDSEYTILRDMLQAISLENGLLTPSDFGAASYADVGDLPFRAWEHDYFTSALPFAQKGDAVSIPLTLADLPVEVAKVETLLGADAPVGDLVTATVGSDTALQVDPGGGPITVKITGLAEASSTSLQGTINQLRIAMQTQKYLELIGRSGTRYNELMRAVYGEDIQDYRINRPEYLGGIKNNVVISEVLQTSQTTNDSALGDFGGHATSYVSGNSINYRCPEHGYVVGILSVRPKTAYFQGIPKKYLRLDYLSEYNRLFAHVGEQAIQNQEVYYDNTDSPIENAATFGYIPRFSEFKYQPSESHGYMRSNLDFWNLTRNFGSRPVLNEEFVYMNSTDMERIFAVTDDPDGQLIAHIFFNMKAKRKIPFFTDPGGL